MSFGLTVTLEEEWLKLYNPNNVNKFFMQRAEIEEYGSLVGSLCTISALYKCDTDGCKLYGDAAKANGDTIRVVLPLEGLESDGRLHVASSTSDIISVPTMSRWQHFVLLIAPGATVWLKAAKLERGSVQTLAHQDADGNWVLNSRPNKVLELAKCQRYQVNIGRYVRLSASFVTLDFIDFFVPLPTTMRATPAFNTNVCIITDGVAATATGFTYAIQSQTGAFLWIRATKQAHGLQNAFLQISAPVNIADANL